MNTTREANMTEPTKQGGRTTQLVHIESSVMFKDEMDISPRSEAYEPCEGTWAEFVGDIKHFFSRIGAEIKSRSEDVRESWNNVFHRNRSHA